ncbi:sigma-54-dependent transcriptional regulator [Roseateles sp. BYS180W]|uniref:HTH-type transcriptional regulatory protein TyrR n=1 Tax=Roseateles rivi TaxID=3299028 RepID=A0ABW7FTN6_9BURK
MNNQAQVLLVEDNPDVALGCQQALQLEGLRTHWVSSAEQAQQQLGEHFAGVVVSDVRLPGMDGLALVRALAAADAQLPVIIITGHGDVSMAVQAMKCGAYDFIQKPFAPQYLVDVVRRALEKRRLVLEVRELRQRLSQREQFDGRLLGRSKGMARVRDWVASVADSAADVLIVGETGTGKEQVARSLHEAGPQRRGHFVAINCGGLPETLFDSEIFGHEAGAYTGAAKRRIGKIEHASGGTLFLDEIESMPLPMQIKLLRVLQERTLERLGSNTLIPVDCRVVAATKLDLLALCAQGGFRSDLYYRLSVATVDLPPLRERREDILLLFEHFVLQAAARHGREAAALSAVQRQQLQGYHWPGNVRELRNVAERCVLGIEGGSAPFATTSEAPPRSLADSVAAFERTLIDEALRQHRSLGRAAQALGVPKTTLHDKIRKFGLS